jgi:hypothetical protein
MGAFGCWTAFAADFNLDADPGQDARTVRPMETNSYLFRSTGSYCLGAKQISRPVHTMRMPSRSSSLPWLHCCKSVSSIDAEEPSTGAFVDTHQTQGLLAPSNDPKSEMIRRSQAHFPIYGFSPVILLA